MTVPIVLVGLPHNGTITPAAARGFHCCSRGAVRVYRGGDPLSGDARPLNGAECGNSFLCGSFNTLLAGALDLCDAGVITHFAMIHSDVEPSGFWLDELWAEMESSGVAVISSVISIKDDVPDPPTSTAIGCRWNRWKVRRCLRLSDRARLPETFGAADVCEDDDEVLLLNTGLWLADLRHPFWSDWTGFNVAARITRDESGRRVAQQRTEDWEWSHDLAEAAVPVAATWRVPVVHRGPAGWPNYAIDQLPSPWARSGLSSLNA